jgi:hypothetical protein
VSEYEQVLTINEIYPSIQGESTHVGRTCVFVRLTACDLRCRWCDTPYAFTGGRKMSIDEVVAEVARHGCRLVEVTGGEPLLQPDASADGGSSPAATRAAGTGGVCRLTRCRTRSWRSSTQCREAEGEHAVGESRQLSENER